jgi:Tfp pilus assembly protein PilF
VRRRNLSILILSSVCIAVVVAVALAATPPNLSRALEAQKRLTVDHPQDPAAFNDLGNLYLLAHQPKDAEAAYRKAVELDPQRVSALFNLGLLLQQRGEAKQALDSFEQVLEIQPEHAWAHYQAGAVYEARGQESKAIDEYAHAFALDPQLAFPEVNPHVVENKLVTPAMLRAYRENYGVPQAPSIYEDPNRIANLLVPPPAAPNADTTKDKDATAAKPATQTPATVLQQPPGTGTGRAPVTQPNGTVLRERDLDTRVTGQAGRGPVHTPGGNMGNMGGNNPRGIRQWERPEPTVQYPSEDGQPQPQPSQPMLAPGQVITPPPAGGVYYRPGYQSSGRLNLQIVPEKRDARG